MLVGVVLAALYLPAAAVHPPYHLDAASASFAAWSLAADGSLVLDGFVDEATRPWFVSVDGHVLTNRQPGVIAHGLPASWLWAQTVGTFSMAPTVWTAALVTATAMAIVHVSLRRLTTGSLAVAGALILGLATSTWSVSAVQLWPHGIGQFWLAAALLALGSAKYTAAGLSYAVAVFTRPPLAIAAAVNGLAASWHERSLRPAVRLGVAASFGVAALLTYNYFVFGGASITGGYSDAFLRPKTGGVGPETVWYLQQVAWTLVSDRGLLVWSPFLLVLLPGMPIAWRSSPAWVRSAALAGVVYLLVHLWLNRYSGGSGFFGYRYPLEPLVLWTPLLLQAWEARIRPDRARRCLFAVAVAVSVAFHLYGAYVYRAHLASSVGG